MKSKQYRATRSRQLGQAVVWFLATIAACCCVFALVYNVGQVTNKKEEAVNAADAAALSGAMVEARMLNFQAYTNRAMVANEVTIAQLVSLDSWMQYNNQLLQNLAIYTSFIPFVDDATSALANGSDLLTQGVEAFVDATVPAVEGVNSGLGAARDAAYHVGAAAANDIAGQIAQANATVFASNTFGARYDEHPELTASFAALALNQQAWQGFFDTGDGRATGKNLVLESRDPFSTQRGNGYLIDAANIGLAFTLQQLEKTSGTTQLDDYGRWSAQDSLDLDHVSISFCLCFPPVSITLVPEPLPIGYGHQDADSDGSEGNVPCYIGLPLKVELPINTFNCQYAHDNPGSTVSWSGLPTFRDLRQHLPTTDPCSKNNESDSPSLLYVMAVQKSGKSTLTTGRVGFDSVSVPNGPPQGLPQLKDNLQNNDNLTSVSSACVFFFRPDAVQNDITVGYLGRLDDQHEYASFYNPYWQARLTAPDPKWTSTLYALIGLPFLDQALQATPNP